MVEYQQKDNYSYLGEKEWNVDGISILPHSLKMAD